MSYPRRRDRCSQVSWIPEDVRPTWWSWKGMIGRCTFSTDPSFKNYGGRGISVCEKWRSSFYAFLADMGLRPEGKTLDRYPNNDGNYEPGNCRWATPKEQANNQRPRSVRGPRKRHVCSLCDTPGHTSRTCMIWRDVVSLRATAEVRS